MSSLINLGLNMATSHFANHTNHTNISYEKESAYNANPLALTVTMVSLTAIIICSFVGGIIYKRKMEMRRENIILADNNLFGLEII
jgi:hypothetical protein